MLHLCSVFKLYKDAETKSRGWKGHKRDTCIILCTCLFNGVRIELITIERLLVRTLNQKSRIGPSFRERD